MAKDILQPSESRFGKEWITYGEGSGLKVDGLKAFQKVASPAVHVPSGIVIGSSVFDNFVAFNSLGIHLDEDDAEQGIFLSDNWQPTDQILNLIPPGAVIAMRSSALDEGTASGAYKSNFFQPTTRDKWDNESFVRKQREVYSSYFSRDARARRYGRSIIEGMGVLIQPVIGQRIEQAYTEQPLPYYMPLISGVMTLDKGEPLIRTVVGLGTRAVESLEAVTASGSINVAEVLSALGQLPIADAISLPTGEVWDIQVTDAMRRRLPSQEGKLNALITEWERLQQNGTSYYLEFAIDPTEPKPWILQASKAIPEVGEIAEFEPQEGEILFESPDTINVGTRYGQGIYYMRQKSREAFAKIAEINRDRKGFLLITPQGSINVNAEGDYLTQQHYINSAGIVEVRDSNKKDPTVVNRRKVVFGGLHFAEECKEFKLFFMTASGEGIAPVLGHPDAFFGENIEFYDSKFKITHLPQEGRIELIQD